MDREKGRRISCLLLALLLVMGAFPWAGMRTAFAADPVPYFNDITITKRFDGNTFQPIGWHIVFAGENFLSADKKKVLVDVGVIGPDGILNRFEPSTKPSDFLLDYKVKITEINNNLVINGKTITFDTLFPAVNAKEPNTGRVQSGSTVKIKGGTFSTPDFSYEINGSALSSGITNTEITTQLVTSGSTTFAIKKGMTDPNFKQKNGNLSKIHIVQSYLDIFKVFTKLGVSDAIDLIPTQGAAGTPARLEADSLLTTEQMDVFFVKHLSESFTKEMLATDKKYLSKLATGEAKDKFSFNVPTSLTPATYFVVLTNKIDPTKPIDDQIASMKILEKKFTVVDAKNQAKLTAIDPKKGPTSGIEATIKGQNIACLSPDLYLPTNKSPDSVTGKGSDKLTLVYNHGKYSDEPTYDAKVTRKIKMWVGGLVTFVDKADSVKRETIYDYFKVKLGQNNDLTKPIKDVTVEIETTIELFDPVTHALVRKIEGIIESDSLKNAFEYEALDFQPEITGVNPAKIPVNVDYKVTPEGLKVSITGKNFFLYRYEVTKSDGTVEVKYRYPKFDFGGQFQIDPNKNTPKIEMRMFKGTVEIDGTEGRHLADKILLTIPNNIVLKDGESALDTTLKLIVTNPLKVPDSTEDGSKAEFDISFFKMDFDKAPFITRVEPSRVSTSAQNKKVKIFGQNFSEGVKVFLDGEEIKNAKRNGVGNEIEIQVPGGKPAGKYQIMVKNSDGSIATFDDFWYVESFTKPKIIDFNPKKGTTYTLVNILGENFLYPNPAVNSLDGIGIYSLIGTRVFLGDYEINEYNKNNGKIELTPYNSKTQDKLVQSQSSVIHLADYADGVILKKDSAFYKIYYDFKLGKYLLTDGKNDVYEIRGEQNEVKAEKNGTAYTVTVSEQKLMVNGEDYFFHTVYAFDAATGLMSGKKTRILSNNQIKFEVPALPRRGFYDVKVVNPDTNSDAKTGKNGFEYIPGPLDLPPKINTITPDKGSVEGGYQVVITGENFISEPTRKIRVYFDGVEVDPKSIIVKPGGKEMTVTVPKYKGDLEKETESDRKAVDVVVLNPDGGSGSKKGGFTYVIAKSKPYLDRIIQHPIDPAVQGLRATVEGGDFRFMEPFKDIETISRPLNGVWDEGEIYTDINGNGKWDDYRELIKNGYSSKEKYNKLPPDNPIRQKYGDWETLIKPVLPEIFFGGYQAEILRFTSTSIDVIIPERARGKVEVYLRNNDEGISNKLLFEILLNEPVLLSIMPNVGRKTGNEPADVIGTGFENSEVLMYDGLDVLPNKKTLVVTRFANDKDPNMGNSHIVDMKHENSGLIASDRAKVNLGALSIRYEGETDPAELRLSYEEYGVLYQGTIKFENNEVFVPLRLLTDAQGKALDSHEAVRITHEMLQGSANSYRIRAERGYSEKTQLKNNGLFTVWTPSYYTIGTVEVAVYGKDGGKSKKNVKFTYKNPDSKPTISDVVKDNDPDEKEIKDRKKILKVSTNGGNTLKIIGTEFRKPVKVTIADGVTIDSKGITYVPAEELNATEIFFTMPKVPETLAGKRFKIFIENPDGGTANTGVLTDPVEEVDEIYLEFVKPESLEMKVTAVIPKEGPITGSTIVTIKGQDFRWEMKGYKGKHLELYFMRNNQPLLDRDGKPVGSLVLDPEQVNYETIEFVTPAVEKEGPVDIKIVNPDGNIIFLPGGFKYTKPKLSIITIDPKTGQRKGGDTVSITGTGFLEGKVLLYSSLSEMPSKAPKMLVRFGDPSDRNISNRDVPIDQLQSGRLLKDGAKFSVGNIDFKIRPQGKNYVVDLTWHDFEGVFSAKDIPFSGETSYLPLSLLKPGATEMIRFQKLTDGVISRIVVERGYASEVRYHGEKSLTVVTPPYYTVNRGAGNKGTLVTVINPDGGEAVGTFMYKNPDSDPQIYSIEVDGISSNGPEHAGENPVLFRLPRTGKSRITVHGTDFRKELKLMVAGIEIPNKDITFSDQIDPHSRYATLTFTMPPVSDQMLGGQYYTLSIMNLDGGSTTSDAVVRDPKLPDSGESPAPIRFTFYIEETEHMEIKSITPNRGPTEGGTKVEIIGQDFRETMYGFNGRLRLFVGKGIDMVEVSRDKILQIEHDRIIFLTPPHEEGEVVIRVQNPDGNTCEGTFTYHKHPIEIFSIDPSQGQKKGGDKITITGKSIQLGKFKRYSDLRTLPQEINLVPVRFGDESDPNLSNRFVKEKKMPSGHLTSNGTKIKVGNIEASVYPNGEQYLMDLTWHDFEGDYRAKGIPFDGKRSYLPLSLLKSGAMEMIVFELEKHSEGKRIIVERGYASTVTYHDETSLTVITPPYYKLEETGTKVTVMNPDGGEASGLFFYKNPDSNPQIYSIDVNGISSMGAEHRGENPVIFRIPKTGKSRITVHGTDFRKELKLFVAGIEIPSKDIIYSDQIGNHSRYATLTFTMPPVSEEKVGEQQYTLSIMNLDGGNTTSDEIVRDPKSSDSGVPAPIHFVFYNEETKHMQLKSIMPDRGPTEGGTKVEIIGQDFRETMYGFKSRLRIFVGKGINQVEVSRDKILQIEHDRIVFLTPPYEEGEVVIRVQNPDGHIQEGKFTYEKYPIEILSIDPSQGRKKGGDTIKITGRNFKIGRKKRYSDLRTLPQEVELMPVRFGDETDSNISNRFVKENTMPSGHLTSSGTKVKVGDIEVTVRPAGEQYLMDLTWHDFEGDYEAKRIPFDGKRSYLPLSLLKSGATEMIVFELEKHSEGKRIIVERGYASTVTYHDETSLTVITPPYYKLEESGTKVTVINRDGGEAIGTFTYKNTDSNPQIYSIDVNGISSNGSEHRGENPVIFRLPRTGKSKITVHGADFRKELKLTIAGIEIPNEDITFSDQTGTHSKYATLTFMMPEVEDELLGDKQYILSIMNLDGGSTTSETVVRDPEWPDSVPSPAPIRFTFYMEETKNMAIKSITPDRGPTEGGTKVEIIGQDFRKNMYGFDGSLKLFMGVGIDMVEISKDKILQIEHDRIVFLTPPHAEGKVVIRVQNPDGNTREGFFTYEKHAIEIFSIDPSEGRKKGGDTITITGKSFQLGQRKRYSDLTSLPKKVDLVPVRFGDLEDFNISNRFAKEGRQLSGYLSQNGTRVKVGNIEVTVRPAGEQYLMDLTWHDFEGDYEAKGIPFDGERSYFPLSLLKSGATEMIAFELENVADDKRLIVERGYASNVTYIDETSLTVVTPPYYKLEEAGTKVTVMNPDGGEASGLFFYKNPDSTPKIDSIAVDGVSSDGAEHKGENPVLFRLAKNGHSEITVHGKDFRKGLRVNIAGVEIDGKDIQFSDPDGKSSYQTLTFVMPNMNDAEFGKPYFLVITNEDGGSCSSNSADPSEGPKVPIYFVFHTPESKLEITSILPLRGPSQGGTKVEILGKDFRKTIYGFKKTLQIFLRGEDGTFEIKPENILSITHDRIEILMPSHKAGKVYIRVQNPDGLSVEYKDPFEYEDYPVITAVLNEDGSMATALLPDGSQTLIIEGTGFKEGAMVYFHPQLKKAQEDLKKDERKTPINVWINGEAYVIDGSIVAAPIKMEDGKKITVKVPELGKDMKGIIVVNPGDGASNVWDIKVGIPEIAAPFDVYAELSFGQMVRVSWKPVGQALQYDVLMRANNGTWQPVANTKDITVSVPNLLPNTTYVFLVKAIAKYGESKPLAEAQSNPVTTGAGIVPKDKDGEMGEKTVIIRTGESVDLRLGEDWSPAGSVVDLLKPEYAGAKNITVRMSAKMVSLNNAPIIIKASDATLVITPAAFRTAEMIQHTLDPKAGVVFKMIRSKAKLQANNSIGQVSAIYELQAFVQVGAQQMKLNQLASPLQLTIKSDAAKIRARKLKNVSLSYYDSTKKMWLRNAMLNKLGYYGMWGSKK